MKRVISFFVVTTIVLLVMTSCATLFYGNKGKVIIESAPDNVVADVLTINRGKKEFSQNNVPFPYKLPVKYAKGKKPTVVSATVNNSSDKVVIEKESNGWIWGNLLWGGIPGIIIDVASGSSSKPERNSYVMRFDENPQQVNQVPQQGTIANTPQLLTDKVKDKADDKGVSKFVSDVDKNIPSTNKNSENTFVLIIANEDYEFVDDVQYALNDGNTFKEYCVKTLGVPEKQVWLYENASYGIINAGVSKMVQAMNLFEKPNAIVYYCGHGIPDEKTGDAYIIPTDGNGKNMSTCYSLNTLYKTFSSTGAANVTYFMDACFTGANKDGAMLVAARGVAREPKKEVLSGNSVVFSATSSDETAMAFDEKQHGLFTYYLLKKLQESKGDVTYEELSKYISANVKKEAFLTNEKVQTPVVSTSPAMQDQWKNLKLK